MPTIEKIRQELENISINRINADLEINSLIEEEELNRQIDDEKINLKIYKNELKGLLNEQDKINRLNDIIEKRNNDNQLLMKQLSNLEDIMIGL